MAERVSDERTGPDTGPADYVALAVRGALGAVPFAGSLLAELAGSVIPNQRIERIAKFAGALDRRPASWNAASLGLRSLARNSQT